MRVGDERLRVFGFRDALRLVLTLELVQAIANVHDHVQRMSVRHQPENRVSRVRTRVHQYLPRGEERLRLLRAHWLRLV